MITTKRPNTDDYTQVGFIEAKDSNGVYQNIDHIYDNQGNIVFQQGYLNEYQGADDFGIPAIGKPLIDYTIWGNSLQSGTPTPDNPIEPEFVGDRTENLAPPLSEWAEGFIDALGKLAVTQEKGVRSSDYIHVTPNVTYWFGDSNPGGFPDGGGTGRWSGIAWYDENKSFISRYTRATELTYSIDAPDNARFARLTLRKYGDTHNLMFNAGSTALPYEPYGYKIPITSGGITKNIYLGQTPTTRKIKKLVLTGEETIQVYSPTTRYVINIPVSVAPVSGSKIGLCTHYFYDSAVFTTNGSFIIDLEPIYWYRKIPITDNRFTTADDFKSYLAAQYANGTPVIVWYVLATPETGIFNEPLARIGDYADSVDFSQAGVEIPTLKKPNTTVIDVETSLEPSEVDVIYRATYRPSYQLFLAANGDSFEAKDGQSLYIGKDEKTTIYGWHVDPNISNSSDAVTYLNDAVGMTPAHMGTSEFNYGSWENAFFMPKPCMVNYDGTVAYYLDPNDYSKRTDGSPSDVGNPNFPGNAMMQWPLIWYKFEGGTEDGEGYFYVANRQVDNTYHCWCNVDSKNNIIPHFYTAIYNSTSFSDYNASTTYAVGDTAVYDGKLYKCITAISEAEEFDSSKWEVWSDVAPDINKFHSMSGLHLTKNNGASNTNGATEITRSTANNTTSDVEWYTEVFSDRLLINALLVLMGKSINTQAVFGRGLDSGGETAKNNYVTGSLNDKGLFWGVTNVGTSGVKVFGMENYWACLWRRTAGCVGVSGNYKIKLTYGTADGTTAEGYNSNGNGYLDSGVIPATGYVKTFRYSENGFVPDITTGGSNFTYYADYFYKGNGYLLVGGVSVSGASCGAFYFNLDSGCSGSFWHVSAALSCKPVWKG